MQWIEEKKAEIAEDELQLDDGGALPDMQVADIVLDRLWFRSILWQLSFKPERPRIAHDPLFPIMRLAPQLHILVQTLENEDMLGSRGRGILQKLSDITRAATVALPFAHDAIQEAGLEIRAQVEDVMSLVRLFLNFEPRESDRRQHIRGLLAGLEMRYPNLVDYTIPL
jgi:hypothetical protein